MLPNTSSGQLLPIPQYDIAPFESTPRRLVKRHAPTPLVNASRIDAKHGGPSRKTGILCFASNFLGLLERSSISLIFNRISLFSSQLASPSVTTILTLKELQPFSAALAMAESISATFKRDTDMMA